MEQRKIIGYKAPFDMYQGKVKNGDLFSITSNPNYYTSNNASDKWLPKEIVEKWDVAYEEEKLEIVEWGNLNKYNYGYIYFDKGKLTQEILDKIKEVI